MSGVRLVDGIVDSEQWLEYLEGEPKFSKYITFENCVFRGEHVLENTITKEITLNNCAFEGEGTLFDLIEGSCVRYLELNNCDGVNQAIDNCWSDLDKIFDKLTIVINDEVGEQFAHFFSLGLYSTVKCAILKSEILTKEIG